MKLLSADEPTLRDHAELQAQMFVPMANRWIDNCLASSAVNLSLQRLIDSFVHLQNQNQPIQTEHEKEHLLEKLSAAETRSRILREELAETISRRKVNYLEERNWYASFPLRGKLLQSLRQDWVSLQWV